VAAVARAWGEEPDGKAVTSAKCKVQSAK